MTLLLKLTITAIICTIALRALDHLLDGVLDDAYSEVFRLGFAIAIFGLLILDVLLITATLIQLVW